MKDLVQAVQALSEKSMFDYIQMIAPLILSVVAIGISIYTSARQNRIALFEKRSKIAYVAKSITSFARIIEKYATKYEDGSNNQIEATAMHSIDLFNYNFNCNIPEKGDTLDKTAPYFRTSSQITSDLLMAEYLFAPEISKALGLLNTKMNLFMVKALSMKTSHKEREEFFSLAVKFEDQYSDKIKAMIKL